MTGLLFEPGSGFRTGNGNNGSPAQWAAVEKIVAAAVDRAMATARPAAPEIDLEALAGRLRAMVGVHRLILSPPAPSTAPAVTIDNPHRELASLAGLIAGGEYVFLYGPPGSGKTTAVQQIAAALARNRQCQCPAGPACEGYGYVSLEPQAGRSILYGYQDISGNYVRTPFREAWEFGHVYLLDECDNGGDALKVSLNTALDGDLCPFPDGLIRRHQDFRCVIAGNTAGRGGDPRFPGRRPLDAAFTERFVALEWGYDERMERAAALAINPAAEPWVTWVQALRAYVEAHRLACVVSPRASIKGARLLLAGRQPGELASLLVWKGLDQSTVDAALRAVPLP